MIRCFIALTLPADIQQHLASIQSNLKQHGAQARWVKPENIHMTLRFLGDQKESRVRQIANMLPEIFPHLPPLNITISTLSAFPAPQDPRVLWAGISQKNDDVIRLFDTLNSGLARLGIPKDRDDFIPHLTLARCKTKEERCSCAEAIKKAPPFSIAAQPLSITFYQSTLSFQEPIYTPLSSIPGAVTKKL